MPRVLVATCAELPAGDEDAALLLASLEELGVEATPAIWDEPGVDWEAAALVLIRCTWDYTERLGEFLRWTADRDRLANPAGVVAWNCDKHYLDELSLRGVPTIPTSYPRTPEELVAPAGERFVVKPTVGAGSMGASRFEAAALAEARAHVAALAAQGRQAMVQPYLEQVASEGETAVIVLGGVPSHAIEKGAMLEVGELDRTGLYRRERIRPREASAPELELAEAALRAAQAATGHEEPFLYARVDLLPTEAGPRVIELELIEPSLFFSFAPAAAGRLAELIAERLSG